jgi:tetratricopeptide (TPR) repeat protein
MQMPYLLFDTQVMAEKKEETIQKTAAEPLPADSELFVGEVREQLTEKDVFVGDETFYKNLAGSSQPAIPQAEFAQTGTSQPQPSPAALRQFSTSQKALAAGIVVIAMTLIYVMLKPVPIIVTAPMPAHNTLPQQHIQPQPQTRQAEPQEQPLSLELAETLYAKKDYNKAYTAYERLGQKISTISGEELMRDFLQLRMARCLEKTAEQDQAAGLFEIVSKSSSPIIRAAANYYLSLLEIQKKQYLQAQARAYQTIALTDAIDSKRDWALSLQRDCYFIAAESITREVLSLSNTDKDLPKNLWYSPDTETEPFDNLNEVQIRSLLNSGLTQLNKGLLSPQIQRLEQQGASPRWSVVCHGASIGELLARFAASANIDVQWTFSNEPVSEQTSVRNRPVSVYLSNTTPQQLITIAAGSVSLLVSFNTPANNSSGTLKAAISNPIAYSALAEHISYLNNEAVSLWHKFLLVFNEDKRIPNAHFALGLLQEQKNQVTDAIAEYKLVANRYPQNSLAPFALLHTGKLRADLRNYTEAGDDLKQLIEQYPDSQVTGQACLHLADATMKAKSYDEAAKLYSKVYHLNLSLESQTASALGAARCFYERKDYENTLKWLNRYIALANDPTNSNLYSVYLMLGKTNLALGKLPQACKAFQKALAGNLAIEKYVESTLVLAETQVQQGNLVDALNELQAVNPGQLSQKEFTEISLLKSKAFRLMGLPDNAIATLGEKTEYIADSQLKARVSLELARCYIAKGDLELARRSLAETLALAEPGPLAQEIVIELADVCLKLGQKSQAISLCSGLLESTPSPEIKQKALNILATIYKQQKDYDKAAAILMGQPGNAGTIENRNNQ